MGNPDYDDEYAEEVEDDEEQEDEEDDNEEENDDNGDEEDEDEIDEDRDFDSRLEAVSSALASAEPPGACFVSGSHARFPLPGLTVAELGEIPLPLTDSSAQQLIGKCRLAPYGHGERTLVDTAVRNTWELDAQELTLRNSEWHQAVCEIAESLRFPLGIGAHTKYDAKLYKMLLYEKGGRFATHRDSEKEPGMFGTLVIVLPGTFEGGELLVHPPSNASGHHRDIASKHEWSPATMNPFDVKYAAFYGDCEHEVLPVTAGYRLCLTYNLVVRDSAIGTLPRSGGNHVYYTQLEMALSHFFTSDKTKSSSTAKEPAAKRRRLAQNSDETNKTGSPPMKPPRECRLVSVLDHKYTDGGLSFTLLKGRDRIVAESLARFCEESNGLFGLYLAKVKYSEITDGMEEEDEEEEEEEKTVRLQAPWIKYTTNNQTSTPVQVQFAECWASVYAEVAPTGFFSNITKFDGEKYLDEEYMGNEGSRMEQWYKTSALVVQPLVVEVKQSMRYISTDQKIDTLLELVRTQSHLAHAYAQALLESTKYYADCDFAKCLVAVEGLRSQALFQQLLSTLSTFPFQPRLAAAAQALGWSESVTTLATVGRKFDFPNRVELLLSAIASASIPHKQIQELLSAMVFTTPTLSTKSHGAAPSWYYGMDYSTKSHQPSVDAWTSPLAKLLGVVYRASSWDEFLKLASTKNADVLIRLVAPALAEFAKSLVAEQRTAQLHALLCSALEQVRAKTPTQRSWAFPQINLHNGTTCCGECSQLHAFVRSTETTLTMQIFKYRRKHLKEVLSKWCEGRIVYKQDLPKHVELEKQHLRSDLFEVGPYVQRVLAAAIADAGADERPRMEHSVE